MGSTRNYKSKTAFTKSMAYIHMHGLNKPHRPGDYPPVEIRGRIHHVEHKGSKAEHRHRGPVRKAVGSVFGR